MGATTTLKAGVDVLTLLEILRKVAAYKGLKLVEGGSSAGSEPIAEYDLDEARLAFLAERGIRRQPRSDAIFTLVDEKAEEGVNYWNFLQDAGGRFELQIKLSVGFVLNVRRRGVVLSPLAHGTFISPVEKSPHFHMFKALVDHDDNAPAIAKELAASSGNIVVTWTELELGGIRKLSDLFGEFAGEREAVNRLGVHGEVFDPLPYPRHQQPKDEQFVVEPAQARLLEGWTQQLLGYRDSLGM